MVSSLFEAEDSAIKDSSGEFRTLIKNMIFEFQTMIITTRMVLFK